MCLFRETLDHYADGSRAVFGDRLTALADFVDEGAPGCDPGTLDALEGEIAVQWRIDDLPHIGAEVARELREFQTHEANDSQRVELLHDLVPAALLDSYGLARDGGEVSEGLNPWEVEAATRGVPLDLDYFRRRPRWTEAEQEEAIDATRAAMDGWPPNFD